MGKINTFTNNRAISDFRLDFKCGDMVLVELSDDELSDMGNPWNSVASIVHGRVGEVVGVSAYLSNFDNSIVYILSFPELIREDFPWRTISVHDHFLSKID
jgi:hypothetical protein